VLTETRITRPPETARPEIVALYDYWLSKAPGLGLLPGRQHIDPTEFPKLLQYVWLLDVVDDPRRFRVRLVGSALLQTGTPARTGDFMADHMPPKRRAALLADLGSVVETREPMWSRGEPVLLRHNTFVHEVERIVLPLAADGRTVDKLLGLSIVQRSENSLMRR